MDGDAPYLAIVAGVQTEGRGRDGRKWSTTEADLAISVLLRPEVSPAVAATVGFAAAVAVYDFAKAILPQATPIGIKWPNDVLVGGKKISGILAEASGGAPGGGPVEWLIVGVGVNLRPAERPAGSDPTDILTAGGPEMSPARATVRLIGELGHWLSIWEREGFLPIREAWKERATGLGGPVEARLPNQTLQGTAVDLAEDGALILALATGEERRIAAGDIFPLVEEA